jgi:23S rRNA pseudouridine2605 synthase
MGAKVRLLQFLLRSGLFSDAKEAQAAIAAGKVLVGGKIVTNGRFEFRPSTKEVSIGTDALAQQASTTIAFHKPLGVLCQKGDGRGRPSVWDALLDAGLEQGLVRSLVAIGRLDIDTSGLLVLTNDGSLVNKVLQPERKVEKEYLATIEGDIPLEKVVQLRKGVRITLKTQGERTSFLTAPARVDVISRKSGSCVVRVVIREGKKRQVRLMFSSVGHPVIALKRVRIGGLVLGALKPGEARVLDAKEIDSLLGQM